ncbi:MAG: hypothetical protein K2Q18_02890 [Bdellovibrionales bacterium]|nr:hypothetical protein [Bdellovibrionales bacterium]
MNSNRASGRKLQILSDTYEEPQQLDLLSLFSDLALPELSVKVKQPRTTTKNALSKNPSYYFHGNVDENKNFKNLCVGESNQFAIEAIKRFISAEKVEFGIVFLKAASGLGKSHILHAVANEMLLSKKPFYFSSPLMMSPLVDNLSLLKMYDVILIDDIEEIEGNIELQKIFCQLMDYAQAGKLKMLVAGIKLPRDLNRSDERMKGKLSASVIHHVDEVDPDLAYNIVNFKSLILGLQLTEEVKRLVSAQLGFNIYGIESLLYKFKNLSEIRGQSITIDLALQEINNKKIIKKSPYRSEEIRHQLEKVAENFSVTYEELVSSARKQEFALARHVAMYVLKHTKQLSMMRIAEIFERDHSSVVYGIARIKRIVDSDFEMRSKIQVLLG